jgi:hypothetical protein
VSEGFFERLHRLRGTVAGGRVAVDLRTAIFALCDLTELDRGQKLGGEIGFRPLTGLSDRCG